MQSADHRVIICAGDLYRALRLGQSGPGRSGSLQQLFGYRRHRFNLSRVSRHFSLAVKRRSRCKMKARASGLVRVFDTQ
jgi:hypothetical protein